MILKTTIRSDVTALLLCIRGQKGEPGGIFFELWEACRIVEFLCTFFLIFVSKVRNCPIICRKLVVAISNRPIELWRLWLPCWTAVHQPGTASGTPA